MQALFADRECTLFSVTNASYNVEKRSMGQVTGARRHGTGVIGDDWLWAWFFAMCMYIPSIQAGIHIEVDLNAALLCIDGHTALTSVDHAHAHNASFD
jgi:hypothetical protein